MMRFTENELQDMGYTAWRELTDGTVLAVGPMLFGNGRLFVDVNHSGYEDCYCYDSMALAYESMMNYNPQTDVEPEGWKRHPLSGRRRLEGNKNTEWIAR